MNRSVSIIRYFNCFREPYSCLKSPMYLEPSLELTVKSELAISPRICSISDIMKSRDPAISLADAIISATSSWESVSGKGLYRSPLAKLSRRLPSLTRGSEIPTAMFFPSRREKIIARIIVTAIAATSSTQTTVMTVDMSFPRSTFTSMMEASWSYMSSYRGINSAMALLCATLDCSISETAPRSSISLSSSQYPASLAEIFL